MGEKIIIWPNEDFWFFPPPKLASYCLLRDGTSLHTRCSNQITWVILDSLSLYPHIQAIKPCQYTLRKNPKSTTSHHPSLRPPCSSPSLSLSWSTATDSPLFPLPPLLLLTIHSPHPSSHSLLSKPCVQSHSLAKNTPALFHHVVKTAKHLTK